MRINVYAHANKDLWRVAKDSVYGNKSYLSGPKYRELQDLVLECVRNHSRYVKWADTAPQYIRELDIQSLPAFQRKFQPYLRLTHQGEGRLQRVLVDHYKTMQDPL